MGQGAEYIYLRGGPLHAHVVLAEPADGELELPEDWPHRYVRSIRTYDIDGQPLPVYQHAGDCCTDYDDVYYLDDEDPDCE